MKKKTIVIIIIVAVAAVCAAVFGIWLACNKTEKPQKHGKTETEGISISEFAEDENSREIIEPETDSPERDENELQEVFIDAF